ncbi:MAG: hypothetical protein JW943_08235 [Deltaproteobacteria bacterium]|nr:hypothetical protein [Deltaproteobacteria bacterium]
MALKKKPPDCDIEKPKNTSRKRIKDLSDSDLVECCVNTPSDAAWTEFYNRYNSFIDKHILIRLYDLEMPHRKDDVEDLSFGIMEKIHGKNLLEKALGLDDREFKRWFAATISNHVRDFSRRQKRQKNAYVYKAKRLTGSLYKSVGKDEKKIFVLDTIAAPETSFEIEDEIRAALNSIEELDEINRLAFRVYIMFHEPLTDDHVRRIASIRSISIADVEAEINDMMDVLVQKNDEYELKQDKLFNKAAYLLRLQSRLKECGKNPDTPRQLLEEIENEIAEKTHQLNNLKAGATKTGIHPAVKDICRLLGKSEEEVGKINVWFSRAKEKLRETHKLA